MASKHDISLDQGSTFNILIALQDVSGSAIDLTGTTFKSQARVDFTAPTASFEFTASIPSPASGQFYLTLPAFQSSLIPEGAYVYDVEMTTGSVVARIIEGTITVRPEVTRT
jgi:hypothetical protein